jgi:hypothetical protein
MKQAGHSSGSFRSWKAGYVPHLEIAPHPPKEGITKTMRRKAAITAFYLFLCVL